MARIGASKNQDLQNFKSFTAATALAADTDFVESREVGQFRTLGVQVQWLSWSDEIQVYWTLAFEQRNGLQIIPTLWANTWVQIFDGNWDNPFTQDGLNQIDISSLAAIQIRRSGAASWDINVSFSLANEY